MTSQENGWLKMSNPSSFSSISFEAETAIKFKKLAREQNKTHTELLNELMEWHAVGFAIVMIVIFLQV